MRPPSRKANGRYRLDARGEPVFEPDPTAWSRWFETSFVQRVVGSTPLTDDVSVSTIFLGLDHNYASTGPPVLWETMIFGGPLDQTQVRCAGSREQAQAMHHHLLLRAQQAQEAQACPLTP